MSSETGRLECKVYVGNLDRGVSKDELEQAFGYYGTIRHIFVARNPPGFAFIEFDDPRDALDSVNGLDGRTVCDSRIRVEMAHGRVKPKPFLRTLGSRYGRLRRSLSRRPDSRSELRRSRSRSFSSGDFRDLRRNRTTTFSPRPPTRRRRR